MAQNEYLVDGADMTTVANAIREKGGTTAPLSFPAGMAEAVRNIQSGADLSLGITAAQVGQIAKITAVDETGKPTKWEPVDIPSGGADISLGITAATVGQTVKVKAVDADGKPTAWEAVEMSGEEKAWTKIIDVEITEATMLFEATGLDNVTELYCEWAGLKTASETAKRYLSLYINDINVGNDWVNNNASNGQYQLGYSISKYNGIVWYNVKSAGLTGSNDTFKTDMGGTARISYMLARDVGAATNVKIKAFNSDNAPVTGQIRVWAR